MATSDRFFGFDLIQRKTLAALLAEISGGDDSSIQDLQDQLDALDARVTDLETP